MSSALHTDDMKSPAATDRHRLGQPFGLGVGLLLLLAGIAFAAGLLVGRWAEQDSSLFSSPSVTAATCPGTRRRQGKGVTAASAVRGGRRAATFTHLQRPARPWPEQDTGW